MGFCIVWFIKPFAEGYLTLASGNLRTASGTRRLASITPLAIHSHGLSFFIIFYLQITLVIPVFIGY